MLLPGRAITEPFGLLFATTLPPAITPSSSPPAEACNSKGAVMPPTCKVPATSAGGITPPLGINCRVTSNPCFSKNPWSLATKAARYSFTPV